jgi:pyrroline-5-carboxylate reductase
MTTRLGIIGLGQMGEAIAKGLLNSDLRKEFEISGTTRSEESAVETKARLSMNCHTDNRRLTESCSVLVLAVKPHQAHATLNQIKDLLTSKHLLVSICASITTDQLQTWGGGKCAIIRAMPNTPCLIGAGMTALCVGPNAQDKDVTVASRLFESLGRTLVLDEALFDGVTGLSGCGPAYVYLMIEALSDAGVTVGISREKSTLLAAQTMMGAAQMVLEQGRHPAALKDEVTTPAGCTIDGLMALEEGRLRATLIRAVRRAARKSKLLRLQG